MQRIIGVVISDGALLAPFCEAHQQTLDVTRGLSRGMWGIGFHGNGEMLLKRGPIGRAFRLDQMVRGVLARHLVAVADEGDGGATVENVQPLRYRDWLVAVSGVETVGADFVDQVQSALPTFAFSQKRRATAAEATMMIFMDALYRNNARDVRKLTTRAIREALTSGAQRLRDAASDAKDLALAVLLHVPGHSFGISLGRPMHLARHRGLVTDPRERPREHRHLRGVIITDDPPSGDAGFGFEALDPWSAVELGEDCEPQPISLAV